MCTKNFPTRIKLYAIINTKIDLSIKKGEMTMEYYAHTREDGERQTVKAHLIGVSKLAEDFSVDLLKPTQTILVYVRKIVGSIINS